VTPPDKSTQKEWFVRYKAGPDGDQIERVETPEEAIERACRLLDDGHEVAGIGMGLAADPVETDQIARIYQMWKRARP
jgi:hypothetical protein